MYITNNVDIAKIAESSGVDRIFIDLETFGKEARQSGMDSVKSKHTFSDIREIRKVIRKSELLVRCNPIHDEVEGFLSTEKEIDEIIQSGADIVMLPFFTSKSEVERFINAVNGRVKTMLLFETPLSIENAEEILSIEGIDECYIGLNDLSIGYGLKFMFQPLANGVVEKTTSIFKKYNKNFGFGGVSSIGTGLLPADMIIGEHYRIGSTSVILSRSFCNAEKTKSLDDIENVFKDGVKKIRECELAWNGSDIVKLLENQKKVINIVFTIVTPK